MAKQRILVCPICGEAQQESSQCRECTCALDTDGLLYAQGSMGPWWVRNKEHPFAPGMTYEHIAELARNGSIERHTLVRGPTTRQLWKVARMVQGIAHLLERCHQCGAHVETSARSCNACQAPFLAYRDRNNLGLDSSEPSEGEIDGMSSFLSDSSILSTQSIPMSIPTRVEQKKPSEEDQGPGSPLFRAVQRSLEQSRRTSKLLTIFLTLTLVGLGIAIWLLL